MKRCKHLEYCAIALFGIALLVKWYLSPSFKRNLRAHPGAKRRGPVLMIRILAKELAKDSGVIFAVVAMMLGAIVGALFNENTIIGAVIGLGSVVVFFNAIPFLLPMPSSFAER
ncbi:hypothetical protein ACM7YY_09625 [Pseudomonas aeruginosa]